MEWEGLLKYWDRQEQHPDFKDPPLLTALSKAVTSGTKKVSKAVGAVDPGDASLIAMAIQLGWDPAGFANRAFGYLAGKSRRELIRYITNEQSAGGSGGQAIIPGSDMAFKRTYGPKRRAPARGYKKKYSKKRVYKKRSAPYKKRSNPTLNLILQGMRNQRG